VCNFLNAQLQNLGSSLAHTRLIEFRASDEGLFGRAPNPALALGGALPNDFKKRASNKEHRRVRIIFIERSQSQKWLLAVPLTLLFLGQEESFCQTIVKKN
jgi:hypothetical protein